MKTELLTFESTCVAALEKVSTLNSLGIFASITLSSVCKIVVPKYGSYEYEQIESVGRTSQNWGFSNFLQILDDAIAFEMQRSTNNRVVKSILARISTDDLTSLSTCEDLNVFIKTAVAGRAIFRE